MKIVIDIPDRIQYGIEIGITVNGSEASQIVLDAVKNGIPLPEGEIVDIRPLMRGLYEERCTGEVIYTTSEVYKMLEEECQVIVEADKEG